MIRFIRQRYGKLRYNTTFGREESPPPVLSLIKDYVSCALRTGLPKACKAMPPVLPSSPESLPGGFSPHPARPAIIHCQPAATPGLHHQRLPPASTAPFPRYPCHGSASSKTPPPGLLHSFQREPHQTQHLLQPRVRRAVNAQARHVTVGGNTNPKKLDIRLL